jgi:PGF-pre-PGF domain-containing protein
MNKKIIGLFLGILLLGFVSASLGSVIGLEENNINITIESDKTIVETHFNASKLEEIETGYGDMYIQEILKGVNKVKSRIENGTPIFEEVDLSGIVYIKELKFGDVTIRGISTSLYDLLNRITEFYQNENYNFGDDATENAEILNGLISEIELNETEVEERLNEIREFSKTLDDYYTTTFPVGYGDVSEDYLKNIESIIKENAETAFNIKDLIGEYIFPNVEESLGLEELFEEYLEDLDYEVSVENLSEYISEMKDGTYEIPINFILKDGTQIEKTIYITLSGIPEEKEVELSEEVSQYVSKIKNLPLGAIVTAKILETESATNGTNLTNLNPLKVIEINVTGTEEGGEIYFQINKSLVSDKDKISLYVLEETGWTKLVTSYIDETEEMYEYSAITPHFSIFMIAEDKTTTSPQTTPSSSGGGRSRRSGGGEAEQTVKNSNNNNMEMELIPEIKTETPQQKSIWQQILEFLGLTGRVTDDGTIVKANPAPTLLILSSFVVLTAILIVLKVKLKK